MRKLDDTVLVKDIARRTGTTTCEARGILHATLQVLGVRLRRVDARAVADRLSPSLAASLLARVGEREPGAVDARYVEAHVGNMHAFTVACRSICAALDEQGRAQLRVLPLPARAA